MTGGPLYSKRKSLRDDIESLEGAWIAIADYGVKREYIVAGEGEHGIIRAMLDENSGEIRGAKGIIEALNYIHGEIKFYTYELNTMERYAYSPASESQNKRNR